MSSNSVACSLNSEQELCMAEMLRTFLFEDAVDLLVSVLVLG